MKLTLLLLSLMSVNFLFANLQLEGKGNESSDTSNIATIRVDSLLKDSFSLAADDPILNTLDKVISEQYFNSFPVVLDTNKLDNIGFCSDSVPSYSSEYYQKELAKMDANTPFNLTYNKQVEGFIKLYANKRRKTTSRMLGLAHMYFPMFEAILDQHDLPLEFKYLAVIESALNPTIKSRAGATGLWQFMYATGKIYGLKATSYTDDRMDPYLATEAACAYFKFLYSLYGNWELVMAAYNCGPGNVNKAIRRSGGKRDYWDLWPFLPRETRGYVPAFIAVNYVMSNASKHNIYPVEPKSTYFERDTVYVKEELYLSQVAGALEIEEDLLKFLNPRYKLQYIPPSVNGKQNVLYLPKDKVGLFIQNENSIYTFGEPSKEEQERLLKEKLAKEKQRLAQHRKVHKVRSGEYLGKIAGRYGVRVSDIKKWNHLRGNNLKIGQKIVIYTKGKAPVVAKKTTKSTPNANYYTIRKGDTLWDIASAKGLSVSKLKSLNANLNFKKLKPGMKIKIKG